MVSGLEAGDSRRQAATRAFKTTAFPMLTGTLVMIGRAMSTTANREKQYSPALDAANPTGINPAIITRVVAILFSPLTGTWLLSDNIRQKAKGPGWMARGYQHHGKQGKAIFTGAGRSKSHGNKPGNHHKGARQHP
jgi:hypothetical protein